MAKRILCVIRTSTIQQEIDSQRNDMFRWLTSQGLGFKEDEIEWLEAKGASARSINKQYLDMLETIKTICLTNTDIKACAFWHLNRLGRWEEYLSMMKAFFRKNLIQVYVKTPNITLLKENENGEYELNQAGDITWNTFASLVEYDTLEMMEKVGRGKIDKKEKGIYVGQPLYYGFKVDENRKVIPNVEEVEIIKLIFNEYATGNYSINKLYVELKSRGIKITERHIQRILTLEIYKQFIDKDLWDKVESIRNNVTKKNSSKESKNCYLALGILKCSCGSNYVSNSGYYTCYRKKMAHRFTEKCTGDSPRIPTVVLDTILWDIATYIHRGYLLRTDKSSIEDYEKKRDVVNQKQQQLQIELDKNIESEDRTKELYIDGALTKAKYESKIVSIKGNISRIKSMMEINDKELSRIEESIIHLQNPDLKAQFALMASVGDITHEKEMKEIVQKHIKIVTLESTSFNGTPHIKINVLDRYDKLRQYLFNTKNVRGDIFDRLYFIDKDATIKPYSYTKKPITEMFNEKLKGTLEVMKDQDAILKHIRNIAPTLAEVLNLDKELTEEDKARIERMKTEPNTLTMTDVSDALELLEKIKGQH